MNNNQQNIIIYNTADGKASVALYAKDGNVWMNQNQLAELFATSIPNISMHIINILEEKELDENSVVKNYLTTAADGKNYSVAFYSEWEEEHGRSFLLEEGEKLVCESLDY